MKVFIASDHGGFALKQKIIQSNRIKNLQDLGPQIYNEKDDYPDFAERVAKEISSLGMDENYNHNAFAILICRSGNGMCIAANKVKGAYAALCFSVSHAIKAREHDNANILCLDSDYEGDDPIDIVKAFTSASFAGKDTRHGRRFQKVLEIEQKY